MYADMSNSRLEKFKGYIEKRGAKVLESNNPYEVIRFKIYGELNIIYRNKWGNLTFSGDQCKQAYVKWKDGKNWTPPNRKRQRLTSRKLKLAKRDGLMCFFCGEVFKDTQFLTIEHLLSFRHGGTDNINNLALACEPCNTKLGSKSITEKIILRDQLRSFNNEETSNSSNSIISRIRRIGSTSSERSSVGSETTTNTE